MSMEVDIGSCKIDSSSSLWGKYDKTVLDSTGHFLLTDHLLDTMKKTAKKSGKEGRIVNVSSLTHRFPYREGIRFDRINDKSG